MPSSSSSTSSDAAVSAAVPAVPAAKASSSTTKRGQKKKGKKRSASRSGSRGGKKSKGKKCMEEVPKMRKSKKRRTGNAALRRCVRFVHFANRSSPLQTSPSKLAPHPPERV